MTYILYFSIRQILMCLLIFLGGHMLFVRLPEQLHNSFFQRSLRLMGIAFFLVPLSCFLYTKSNQLDLDKYFAAAISLSAYFATFIFMSLAFLILLGKNFSKLIMRISTAVVFLYPLPLWLSLFNGNEELISTVTTASYSYFVIITGLLITNILLKHRKVSRNINNFFSDDVTICVKWISESIILLLGLTITSLIAPVFSLCSLWLRLIFMLYGVFCYIYIYYGYRRMLINMTTQFILNNRPVSTLVEVERGDHNNTTTLSAEVTSAIQQSLELWIAEGKYMQKGITINAVAKEIQTNRTYLSKYINVTYNLSFKSWISQLRIKEAKRLLIKETNTSVSIISALTGFASVESFTHIFTRLEGESPSKWREKQDLNQ